MKKKNYRQIAKKVADKIILLGVKYCYDCPGSMNKRKNNELNENFESKASKQ